MTLHGEVAKVGEVRWKRSRQAHRQMEAAIHHRMDITCMNGSSKDSVALLMLTESGKNRFSCYNVHKKASGRSQEKRSIISKLSNLLH